MARVPISFYLNILAGIFVLFNHYASSETGDVALNKVTGAAGRFYTLFRDTALTFQHGYTSRLQSVLCGGIVDGILSHGAAEYLRVRYCYAPAQNSESVGGTLDDRHLHGGYGSSDAAFVYYRFPLRPISQTPTDGLLRRSPVNLNWLSQRHLSQVVWDRSSEAMATVGMLLLRTCASWWWFRAPLKVTGILLAAYATWSALECWFGANVAPRYISQVYLVVVIDFLRCIEWEAQRHVSDMGVMMMECAFCAVRRAHKCL